MANESENSMAPEGTVWVCAACGKRSRDRYGTKPIDWNWDVSCTLNAMLCRVDSLVMANGRVVRAEAASLS